MSIDEVLWLCNISIELGKCRVVQCCLLGGRVVAEGSNIVRSYSAGIP